MALGRFVVPSKIEQGVVDSKMNLEMISNHAEPTIDASIYVC